MPRKADLPSYLTSPIEQATLAAELEDLADGIDPRSEPGQASRLDRTRAARLRDWARQTEGYRLKPDPVVLEFAEDQTSEFLDSLREDTAEQH